MKKKTIESSGMRAARIRLGRMGFEGRTGERRFCSESWILGVDMQIGALQVYIHHVRKCRRVVKGLYDQPEVVLTRDRRKDEYSYGSASLIAFTCNVCLQDKDCTMPVAKKGGAA